MVAVEKIPASAVRAGCYARNHLLLDIWMHATYGAVGMAVTAEIKTGTRCVIEYLMPPLLRYEQENVRER